MLPEFAQNVKELIMLLVKENVFFVLQFLLTVKLVKLEMLLLLQLAQLALIAHMQPDLQLLLVLLVLQIVNHALQLPAMNAYQDISKVLLLLQPVQAVMLVVPQDALK